MEHHKSVAITCFKLLKIPSANRLWIPVRGRPELDGLKGHTQKDIEIIEITLIITSFRVDIELKWPDIIKALNEKENLIMVWKEQEFFGKYRKLFRIKIQNK